MADLELKHSAKGTSWIKRNHLWVSRKKVNGKWVYTYKTEQGHKDAAVSALKNAKKNESAARAAQQNLNRNRDAGLSYVIDRKNNPLSKFNIGKRIYSAANNKAAKYSSAKKNEFTKASQKAYSDYESQKRMAASAAGAATRSNQYKNAMKRKNRKVKRQAMIKKGKAFVRDLITRLTDKKKYEAQQEYKRQQELNKKKKQLESQRRAAARKRSRTK